MNSARTSLLAGFVIGHGTIINRNKIAPYRDLVAAVEERARTVPSAPSIRY